MADQLILIWYILFYPTDYMKFNKNWFEPVSSDLILLDPIWSLLIQFSSILSDLNWFVPIWSGLIQFYPIWSNVFQFVPINLIKFTLIWLESIWTNLIWFDPIWTNFIWLEPNNQFDSSWSISLRPESSENIPILLQEAGLCFSKQNCQRNPKMGSKQSVVVATQ